MTPVQQIITLLSGAGLILFVAWYFFGKKEEIAEISGTSIAVKVDAGYSPSTIVIKKNQSVTLKITRSDPSDCLEEIVIPEFKIKKSLPLNQEIEINLEPKNTGEFPFHCGMNMFHGKIVVKD
ncbi:MAG: cupredoxin domain-containing protein [Patescibacteria group bacterium]